MTDEERKQRFQFFNDDASMDIETPKTNMIFWQLSKKSNIYGKGSGDSRPCYMCRRCGAVVGDYTLHTSWHIQVEGFEIENIHVSATYL